MVSEAYPEVATWSLKEVVVEGAVRENEGIEPFDWEDYLYESWLEEKREQKKNRPAAGVSV